MRQPAGRLRAPGLLSDTANGPHRQVETSAGVRFTGLHASTDGVGQANIDPAENFGCDMIVMLTHGLSSAGQLPFGSHTQQLLAKTSLPLRALGRRQADSSDE